MLRHSVSHFPLLPRHCGLKGGTQLNINKILTQNNNSKFHSNKWKPIAGVRRGGGGSGGGVLNIKHFTQIIFGNFNIISSPALQWLVNANVIFWTIVSIVNWSLCVLVSVYLLLVLWLKVLRCYYYIFRCTGKYLFIVINCIYLFGIKIGLSRHFVCVFGFTLS